MDGSGERFEVPLREAAAELARLGAEGGGLGGGLDGGFQLVLAESCTGGLIAAVLTGIPGASKWFCGSSVVYQEASKFTWLDISEKLIDQYSAESPETTAAMSRAILNVTQHATLSLATTGHLEPDSQRSRPEPHVFVSIVSRGGAMERGHAVEMPLSGESRLDRQRHAAAIAVRALIDFLSN
jgi:PncC family amidohydrolase